MRSLLHVLIRLGALLVPASRRRAWTREWRGEVGYALEALEREGPGGWRGVPARLEVAFRTASCLVDAFWIRWDEASVGGIRFELRGAIRSLRRAPGFTVSVLGTLGVAIGACTAIFSVAHAVLFRPLPFPEPDRLSVILGEAKDVARGRLPLEAPDAALLREHTSAFEGIAFVRTVTDGALTGTDEARAITLARVTDNVFDVLGVAAGLGRVPRPGDGILTPAEAARDDDDLTPLPPTVVVLSHDLWTGGFGADPGVLGTTVRIDGNPAVVIGVMPPDFRMPLADGGGHASGIDAWTPLRFDLGLFRRTERLEDQDSETSGSVLARRKEGVSPASAARELAAVTEVIRRDSPIRDRAGFRLVEEPLGTALGRDARPLLLALLGASALALLIGCLDVAGLFFARSVERERDSAVRAAMGAGRGRLVGEAFAEAALVGVGGGVLGVALAFAVTPRLTSVLPPDVPRLAEVEVSIPVLAFALGVTLLTVLVCGTLAAVRPARTDPAASLSGTRGGSSAVRAPTRAFLVGGQLALVTVLVVGSLLLVRTVQNLQGTDPGFRPDGVLAFDLDLVFRDGYRGPGDRARFLARLEERIGSLPAVEAVGATGALPLSGRRFVQPWALPDQGALGDDPGRQAHFRVVAGEYFRAVGTRVLAGRAFIPVDDDQDRRVVIVDESLARRIAGDPVRAVGSFLRIPVDGQEVRAEVVGVVENVRHEDLRGQVRPAVYVPYRHEASRHVSVLVRSTGDPGSLAGPIREATREMDPRLALHRVRTLEELMSRLLAPTRFLLGVFVAFGILSLLLSAMGVFGIVAWEVRRRRRELGVRAALGATRSALVRLTLGRSLVLGVTGMTGGVLASLLASRFLGAVVYEVEPADPRILALAAGVILGVTILASWIPARAAVRTSPMQVLRED